MNTPTYYLISYYARLPQGGFGFSRTYYSIPANQEFNINKFEQTIAKETNLKPNDIALLSRIKVTVEEYNENNQEQ